MRATVVGAGGNLGRHLCEELLGAGHSVDPLTRAGCDLSRPAEALALLRERLSATRSDVVINTAAFTDVDGAEQQADLAFTVNALGAEAVARAAHGAGVPLCHISTDFVFRGDQDRPYDEFDLPIPRGVYARSKRAGEELVLCAADRGGRCYLVRVEGLYGRGGKNFVSTLAARLFAGQKLTIDRERRVTPTWVRALARQLIVLCTSGEGGTYHATCDGETTWHEFAEATCQIAEALGRPLSHSWQPVATAELRSPAPRPAMSVLDNRMLRLRGLYQMPPWRAALSDYLAEIVAHGDLGPPLEKRT
jgi:dTDP-4-dehydrorhamnose reductase